MVKDLRRFCPRVTPSSTPSSYGYIPLAEFWERWHDHEIRDGKPVRYFNEGIAVRGTHPLTSIPADLRRVQ